MIKFYAIVNGTAKVDADEFDGMTAPEISFYRVAFQEKDKRESERFGGILGG